MKNASLNVYVFNIGAGDHLLLEFPDGTLGIIDSFFQTSHLNLKEVPGLTYLKSLVAGKKKANDASPVVISFLCISHADLDHLTGLDMMLDFIEYPKNNITVENLWLFGGIDLDEYTSEVMRLLTQPLKKLTGDAKEELLCNVKNYKRRLDRLKIFRNNWRQMHEPERSERYFDDCKAIDVYGTARGFHAWCIGPLAKMARTYLEDGYQSFIRSTFERVQDLQNKPEQPFTFEYKGALNRNCISSILCIVYGNYNLMFGGDATKEIWESSLKDLKQTGKHHLLQPDFLKASHHGSKSSSSPEIWDILLSNSKTNLFVGISAGKRHSHPNDEVFKEISESCCRHSTNATVVRTNECTACLSTHFASKSLDWFNYENSLEDRNYTRQINEAFENECAGNARKMHTTDQAVKNQNLLAYVFVFPEDGDNNSIEVLRGTAEGIGTYNECVFKKKSNCFCNCIAN